MFSGGCVSKSDKLYAGVNAASFDQLVLEGTLKQQIRDDFTQFLAARATYEEAGVPWRRGALFVGPPGNGKTLCVKALVRELGIPCLYVQSFEAQYQQPQKMVEAVFKRARTHAPCVLVLEDIDALLVPSARSFFLNELDGFASNAGVITLATTNHPERLDPSIVERPSRFDRKYHFELPSTETREAYVRLWNERLRPPLRLSEAGRTQISELTHDFSFAYMVVEILGGSNSPGAPMLTSPCSTPNNLCSGQFRLVLLHSGRSGSVWAEWSAPNDGGRGRREAASLRTT